MKEYVEREAVLQVIEHASDGYEYIEMPVEYAIEEFNAIPVSDVVPWEWLKRYAHGKGMQNASTLIFEAMEAWGKENQGWR